jgi:hypothetical protein
MLDPERIGLNAQSVGYMMRRKEKVDWASFKQQLQTDDGGCVNVRRQIETPVNEIHVMGGELKGLESNSNMLDRERQHRQMNAYPLRSFSADAPAIILPPKYGGLPMYTRNQVQYADYVSRFTEPMSAPLQRDTELLGSMGFTASNESASNPYRSTGFEHNMHKSQSAINMNEAIIRQRRFLEVQSKKAQSQKRQVRTEGVFVSANGDPITEVEDIIDGDRATINAFQLHRARQENLQNREGMGAPDKRARVDPRGGMAMVRGGQPSVMRQRVVNPVQQNLVIAQAPNLGAVAAAVPFMGGGAPAAVGGGLLAAVGGAIASPFKAAAAYFGGGGGTPPTTAAEAAAEAAAAAAAAAGTVTPMKATVPKVGGGRGGKAKRGK